MNDQVFKDRSAAGKELAAALETIANPENALVLGLPRGGVPVAYEVAAGLGLPLDILVVRKMGAPGQPELAMGAVGSGGVRVINERVVKSLGVREETLEKITAEEHRRVEEKESFLREGREGFSVAGKQVILVDDGLATGASMRAAAATVKARDPKSVVVAIPVAPSEAVEQLRHEVDRVVCVTAPSAFTAVGQWYRHFDQTSDREVQSLLRKAHHGGKE